MLDVDMTAPGFEKIVTPESRLDVIAHDLMFGEGPVWNKRTGEFFWVDIIGDTIWKWKPGGARSVVVRPSYRADGMTFDLEGRLVVAGWSWRRVWRLEHDGSITTLCSEFEGQKLNSPNDIVVKSDGSIWFTDPSGGLNNVEMHGDDVQRYMDYHGVFRISPDGKTTTLVVKELTYPNGLAFTKDEKQLYINDTRENNIRVWDVNADGTLSNKRMFCQLQGPEAGVADGMKVDEDGNVYCTGPAGIHVHDKNGKLLGRILIPGHTTNLGFGDADWKSLFITTYTSVFRVRLGVAGLPVW
ncbi:MAG TPA: SMP-30/gluconolactonase/LRE family protein [Burkholderiales bacterium]|jgi:gluconolactonase